MITALRRNWQPLISIATIGFSMLASGAVSAQPAGHGVQLWQAERAIREFVDVFVSNQVLANDYSKVRVKISEVRAVYNKEVGWIYVAIFEGGVVPNVYFPNQTQTYSHGILKVAADKSGVVHEAVVNEGKGLMQSTQKSSILYQQLHERPGDWASWGGSRKPPGTSQAATPKATVPQVAANPVVPTPSNTRSSGAKPTAAQAAIINEYHAAKNERDRARKQNPPPANIQTLEARYQKAYVAYIDMASNPGKYR